MAAPHKTEGLPSGMTRVPVLMPVDQYAQLCVSAQLCGRDPAWLLGWLVEIALAQVAIDPAD